MVKNGCGQSGYGTLNLTLSQEWIGGMNEMIFLHGANSGKLSYFTDFWVGEVKNRHGYLFSS